MFYGTRLVILSIFILWNVNTNAQISFPNAIQAIHIPQNVIKIDGNLDEEIWQQAPKISNFTQRELNFGELGSEKTEVAIAYNDDFLYIAVWCYDANPHQIIAKELRRDFNYELDDNFIVIIDTYQDKRNGFMFVTNPNAARADLQVFNNGGSVNAFWNGVWNVKTKRTENGWFAEFEIPFYTLKYRNGIPEQKWGINFERNIRYKREQMMWQGWSRDNRIQQVNQAGVLEGLNQLRNKQFVEIKPYAIGGGELLPNKTNTLGNMGGDINYLLSPTYRLNLTFNTDFAQVESDQQQINLTRFPLFFPELREFFLEGDDFFNMGYGGNRIFPFYTRKIGLNDQLQPVPIIAGARILGKENNSTIGLMSIQTADALGQTSTNYSTASWRQDLGRQSFIGAMTTNTFNQSHWHTTTGINGRYSTAKLLRNKNFEFGGALIKTYNSDSGYQNDAYAYRAFVNYPNDKLILFASTQQSPAGFNPEVGLQLRKNFREDFALITLRPRPKKHLKWIRQYEISPIILTHTQYNDTRNMQSFEYICQFLGFYTKSGEEFRIDYRYIGEGLTNDFTIADDIIIPKNNYWWRQFESEFRTFRGRTFSIITRMIWGDFYNGHALRNRSELFWRTGKYLNTSARYEFNEINLPGGSFTTHLIGNRIEYALNPNAFGSMLTQWNTAQKELNLNFRLHIIPKIGTDFFFIINQVFDTRSGRIESKRGTILGKLVWRFAV